MEFDLAFVSWVKVLLDLLKLSNFLSLYSFFPKTKIICFLFQAIKNDLVLRRFFERYITVLSVSVDIKGDFFFQLASGFFRLDSKFKISFSEESKIPWQHLNTVYAPIYS